MIRLFNNPIEFLAVFFAFLVAITVHECAHAWMADRLGDPTAKLLGRMTLNPFAHLDLIGTLMIVFASFGWAKPVEIDPFNLRNPKRDTALIAFSGPTSNLLTAVFLSIIRAVLFAVFPGFSLSLGGGLLDVLLTITIVMNVNLAVFNLIPIHPLDGYSVVGGFLSGKKAQEWHELKRYGILFLLFLIFPLGSAPSPLSRIMSPVINGILSILLPGTTGI